MSELNELTRAAGAQCQDGLLAAGRAMSDSLRAFAETMSLALAPVVQHMGVVWNTFAADPEVQQMLQQAAAEEPVE